MGVEVRPGSQLLCRPLGFGGSEVGRASRKESMKVPVHGATTLFQMQNLWFLQTKPSTETQRRGE